MVMLRLLASPSPTGYAHSIVSSINSGMALLKNKPPEMMELNSSGLVDGRIPAQDKLKISKDNVERAERSVNICFVLFFKRSAYLKEIRTKRSCL